MLRALLASLFLLVAGAAQAAVTVTGTPATLVDPSAAYSATLTATGATGAVTWDVSGLPSDFSITVTSATTISITASAGVGHTLGKYPIVAKATDSIAASGTKSWNIFVATPPTASSAGVPGTASVSLPYSGQITVTGGIEPFSYSVTVGSLPTGVTLRGGGILSGTPTTAGAKTATVRLTDAAGQITTTPVNITVATAGTPQTLVINAFPDTTAQTSVTYTTQFYAGGGTTPYVYSLASGSGALPSGLSINSSSGIISGAPLSGTAGTYPNITLKVTDAASNVATATPYTLVVTGSGSSAPTISSGPGRTQAVGASFLQTFTVTNGTSPYSFATIGTLPAGLSLSSSGAVATLSGTIGGPPGRYSFQVRVTDNVARTATSNALVLRVTSSARHGDVRRNQ